uniref:DUF1542 domain-containing protein n=1 Tax=Streptococcus sp. k-628 TaxID=2582635 RepID=UPI001565A21F
VETAAEKAKKAIDDATTNDKVDEAKNNGNTAIDNINPTGDKKSDAKKEIDKAAEAKKDEIDKRTDLTKEEKDKAKSDVETAAEKAKKAIDDATTNDKVDEAKNNGNTAIDNINPTGDKKSDAKKETSKEQGHLPYGTMIGGLLALLGLLLFLIARRKKESELKKLTKELTKVLQESDLTNVDAKVLDKARETLAQAVAFLANEKESDHTEDELIDKLKAILTQLR